MSQSAGHLIVRTLEAHGVQRVYLVPGESYLDVLDGLYDSPIQTVVCRQEGGAGFMALTEGRLTSLPGVAFVTRGPGAANAMIAVHTAWQDATALVLFVGLVPVPARDREAFQEFSLVSWYGSTAKRVLIMDDPLRAGEIVNEAMRIAASGRPGPVVVGLPEDLLTHTVAAAVPVPSQAQQPAPSHNELVELEARLSRAAKPLFVVGGDGWEQGAGATLAEYAVAAGVPVVADWRAHDSIPHTSPAWAGWLGYGRAAAVAQGYREADLLVFVGCVRGDALSDGYTAGLDTETVLVTTDPEASAHAGRIDQMLLASPDAFAREIASRDAHAARGTRDDTWLTNRSNAQEGVSTHRADAAVPGSAAARAAEQGIDLGVDLGIAFGILDDRLGGEASITYGASNAAIWAQRFVRHHRAASLVAARNGAMGLAVPAAVAAALVQPGRRVVAVCGDGDFLMTGHELATAFACGVSPLVIVVDNGVYGTIVLHQSLHYPGRPSGTKLVNPLFADWLRSFGGHGEYVTHTSEFEPALDRALQATGPALLHLVVSPSVMPPGVGEM